MMLQLVTKSAHSSTPPASPFPIFTMSNSHENKLDFFPKQKAFLKGLGAR